MARIRRRLWTSLSLGTLLVAGCSSADSDAVRGDGNPPPPMMVRGTGGTGDKSTVIPGGMIGNAGGNTGNAGTTPPLGSGGDGAIDGECAAISQTAENHLQPADIVIAVDNSGSMDEEIVFVRQQLNAFSQQIVDSGIDVRIILITAPLAAEMPMQDPGLFGGIFGGGNNDRDNGICIDPPLGSGMCPADSNPPAYLHVPVEVGSNDALELIVSTFGQWRDHLRPNATKSFVVVTDDNAENGRDSSAAGDPAATFSQALTGLDAALFMTWRFSGIFCFSDCEQAAKPGDVYKNLVTQTLGVSGDLCLQDFAPVFDELARAVIEGSMLDCEWAIPPPPSGETFEPGKVNVQYVAAGATAAETVFHVDNQAACGATGGWYYDDSANATRILACPSTCDLLQGDGGAKIDVLFGCATMDGPD
jgi:hypothetical protein